MKIFNKHPICRHGDYFIHTILAAKKAMPAVTAALVFYIDHHAVLDSAERRAFRQVKIDRVLQPTRVEKITGAGRYTANHLTAARNRGINRLIAALYARDFIEHCGYRSGQICRQFLKRNLMGQRRLAGHYRDHIHKRGKTFITCVHINV